jgi:dTDP-4-amino-4,6-dideoxygalactose transaminase
MMYPVVLAHSQVDKKTFLKHLNENHIETRDMMPIVSQPIYSDMIFPPDFPVAKYIDENGFYIGCHQDIEPDDIEYVRQVINDYLSFNGVVIE